MNPKLSLQVAIALHQEGRLDEAKEAYFAILEGDPACLDALHRLGMLHVQQNEYALATTQFEQILSYDPDDVVAHLHLGNCCLRLYKIDSNQASAKSLGKARYHFEQAIRLKPDYVEAYNALGNLFHQQDDLLKAMECYQKAVLLRPNYLDALVNLGTISLKLERMDEAQHYFEQIVALYPSHDAANFQLGNIAYQRKQLDQALVFYEKIPYHLNAQLNMGSIFLEKGLTEKAIEKFIYVLSLEPKHLFAHSNLAALYVTQKDFDKAISHYYEILSQDPDYYTAHFNLGAIYMQQRKWETAAYHLAIAIRLQVNDPDAHDNFATTLLKLNRIDLAKEHYQRALALRPEDEIAAYRLAALTGTNQPEKAPGTYIQMLFDNYADNFDHELMDSLQYKVPEAIHHLACRYLNEQTELRIVDLGCGTGLAGRYFVTKAKQLIGVDLSSNMLKIAEKKHIYDNLIEEEMATALTAWKNEIDLIIAADSFVYIGDMHELLTNAHQALRDGGYLIFTTESGYQQDFQLTDTGRYLHHADYLKRLATETGFEVLELIQVKLREQKGVPVNGYLVMFTNSSASILQE
ncbi:MAG: tetratricopeptide repeat protein [Legionellales bacterium]|nr:tetratricopeptide repeat protein [Legionellales bacterium]